MLAFLLSSNLVVQLFIQGKRKEKQEGSLPSHSLVLQHSVCGLLALSLGNSSNAMRNAAAAGGECLVLNGTGSVTLSGVEYLHTSNAAQRGLRVRAEPAAIHPARCQRFMLPV